MHSLAAATAPDLGSLHLNSAVTAGVGLFALAVGAVLWFTGQNAPRLVVLLIMTGTSGLLGTPIGAWLRSASDWLNQTTNSITARWAGATVTGLLAAVATFVLIMRMKDSKVDNWTLALAVLVPVSVATIPGSLGHAAYVAVTALVAVIGWAISQAFGIA